LPNFGATASRSNRSAATETTENWRLAGTWPNLTGRLASHSPVVRAIYLCAFVLALSTPLLVGKAVAGTSPVPDAAIPGKTGFLTECLRFENQRQINCYVRGLLAMVERSGDPARELPRIDRRVHQTGGFLEAACHPLMHFVGRAWARRHHLTLESLYRYVPRSNDPGCSSGFGMGLAMYLGPTLVVRPRSVLHTCNRLPTRFREYTCIHGAGHAFMRGFHSQLVDALRACKTLGPRNAPDCSQGAFHDYWIALSGGDGTTPLRNADTSPRSVCSRTTFVRPCWFRFFWERMPSVRVDDPADITRLCAGLQGIQRGGCVAGASLSMSRALHGADHARTCSRLDPADAVNCIRGVVVPAVAGRSFEQVRLINVCREFPKEAMWGCFSWFGRTLAVVTNGRFTREGCPRLEPLHAQISCVAGARRMQQALGTFS
jgi:hypothetical protein